MKREGMLSVIIPSYNEEGMISITANTLSNLLKDNNIKFELIFVDDGSQDTTWDVIEDVEFLYSKEDVKIVGVKFSRNFGKEAAIRAGLETAKGDCVAVIDCDLQHPPEKLIDMYYFWSNGFDVVEGIKENRGKESIFHKFFIKIFYSLMSNKLLKNMYGTSDFKLLDRKVVNEILRFSEREPFFRAESIWVGFKNAYVRYETKDRLVGESKWKFSSLTKYAIKNITSYSTVPTIISIYFSIVNLFCFLLFAILSIVNIHKDIFTLFIILTILFLQSGLIMCFIGINGYYLNRVFIESISRPQFIIETISVSEEL